MSLDLEQMKAVSHNTGPMLVVAGPGSGKTTVLTHRILNLIETHHISPDRILVITFTKTAAIEMKLRFQKLCKNQFYPVNFGTFHAVFYQILQDDSMGKLSILSETDKIRILEQILVQNSLPLKGKTYQNEILKDLSAYKNCQNKDDFEPHGMDKSIFMKLFEDFEYEKSKMNKIDFDDMVILCRKRLLENEVLRKRWRDRFRYLLVDEFQDISPRQYETLKLLLGNHHNLFAVGDDDQSIYSFRGAGPKLMFQFIKDFPECIKIQLSMNYRCPNRIVNEASFFISHNKERFEKNIRAVGSEKGIFQIYQEVSQRKKYQLVCEHILNLLKNQTNPSDIVLLFRTNTVSPILLKELLSHNIPFVMKEKWKSVTEHFITKDFCSFLRLACNQRKRKDLYAIMNKPNRFLSRSLIESEEFSFEILRQKAFGKTYIIQAVDELENKIKRLSEMDPFQAVIYIRKGFLYEEFLIQYASENHIPFSDYQEILDFLEQSAKEYDTLREFLFMIENPDDTNGFANKDRKLKDTHEFTNTDRMPEDMNGILLSTIHSAKGLEWKNVLIPDFDEGQIPHKRCQNVSQIEEERRLFYVAMTRAKEALLIYTYNRNLSSVINSSTQLFAPSPFLYEMLDFQNNIG